MPRTPCRIIIDPQVSVNVTISTAGGVTATAYTSENGSSQHSFPVTISTATDFWLTTPGDYTISALHNSVEIAGSDGTTKKTNVSSDGTTKVLVALDMPSEESSVGGGSGASAADVTALLALPKVIREFSGYLAGGTAVGNQLFGARGANNGLLAPAAGEATAAMFGFDPADYAVAGKTLQVSVFGTVWNANNTEAASVSVAMLPITTIAGAGNITAFGAATASVEVHAAGAATAVRNARSTWVTAPAAGPFVLALVIATATTSGILGCHCRLAYRHF